MEREKNSGNLASMRKPAWLRKKSAFGTVGPVKGELRKRNLNTVCESAKCPNIGECFSRNTATFMILGDKCTRNCSFCAVETGKGIPPDPAEPQNVAGMALKMGLKHVVVTSVTRDDLSDQGAAQFAMTTKAIRAALPVARVELLVPDLNKENLDIVLAESPHILNHNVETVPSLYPRIRPQGDFRRSLMVLRHAVERGFFAKSGIMVGLGETLEELKYTIAEVGSAGTKMLTVGQYLAPSRKHAPVERYYEEGFFEMISGIALDAGFEKVFAGPFVRSSYMADKA